VPKWRSNSSSSDPAMRAGKASRPRIATRNIDHIVVDMRKSDRPFVRRFKIVVTKLRPPIVNDAMKNTIAMIQSVCPFMEPGMAFRTADSGG
jgi:hypothetical protein